MRALWRFLLLTDVPAGALGGVAPVVLGLGDAHCPKLNAAARRLAARLGQLGSAPLARRPATATTRTSWARSRRYGHGWWRSEW